MAYDLHDTIAAVASAAGGAARGVVRISGPDAVKLLACCFRPSNDDLEGLRSVPASQRIRGAIMVVGTESGQDLSVPGALLLWPGAYSYTRQPSAEFHTIGSPPLLAAVLEELGRHGIRPAEPGEFTLRAFVAGRIDLTQAEGVLGVIDAQDRSDLDAALDQVAGGLSRPLHQIREDLLSLLAELEAGLDFVEEDIEFISRQSLADRIANARSVVAATQTQLCERGQFSEVPRIVLVGAPNAGKSSLFNALLERFGDGDGASSIVSPRPGATRDYVVGRLRIGGVQYELVDTAGVDAAAQEEILQAAQAASSRQRRTAELRVVCTDSASGALQACSGGELVVLTKVDLIDVPPRQQSNGSTTLLAGTEVIRCSSVTGEGLDTLAARIRAAVGQYDGKLERVGAVAATSARCRGSLRRASESLEAAAALVAARSDELLAAEIRHGLDALGEIVGAICADDVLDRVFGQFCIGK
jgi:tRNA modification GTPase